MRHPKGMLELAAIINVDPLIEAAGYPLVLLLVMAESGGVPVPGETALIAGAVFASQGKLSLPAVIAIAAAGAIVGDNIGYVIGRRGGRWLLQKPGPFHRQRLEVLATGEPFFERHGPKAVFFGRFILGLRTWASWLAGATKMRWRTFALWNAIGGIIWASAIGIAAYYIGRSAESAVSAFGIYGLVAVAIAALSLFVAHRRRRRRSAREDEAIAGRRSARSEETIVTPRSRSEAHAQRDAAGELR
jgi:membrane protein DedA with SNARE-associated domain